MNLDSQIAPISQSGTVMYQLIYNLYPICRSITGNGVRKTLEILQQHIPLEIHQVPTGTQVFDWTVYVPRPIRKSEPSPQSPDR